MKKIIKNILFLLFLFCNFFFNAHILNAKTLPPGTGIADVPANILLMLDTSGSMGWSIGTTDAILKYPTGVDVDSSGNILGVTVSGRVMGGSPVGINFFIPSLLRIKLLFA